MNRRLRVPYLIAVLLSIASTPALLASRMVPAFTGVRLDDLPTEAPGPLVVPLDGPYVVAVQPGHWKIDELPAELTRRERSIGAVHAGVRELDINLAVVEQLVPLLETEGWEVIVVPATVPPGLRADVFISVHADWGADPNRSGWKLAPPWRPSHAATLLAESLKESFRARDEMTEDIGGITVGMRGYFGFASHRYVHAASPYTPAVLVELGFVTNAVDRARMVNQPAYYADIIHEGIRRHFSRWTRMDVSSLVPRRFDSLRVDDDGATVYKIPDPGASALGELRPGSIVRPVDHVDGWYEVTLRNPWAIAWVSEDDLIKLN